MDEITLVQCCAFSCAVCTDIMGATSPAQGPESAVVFSSSLQLENDLRRQTVSFHFQILTISLAVQMYCLNMGKTRVLLPSGQTSDKV